MTHMSVVNISRACDNCWACLLVSVPNLARPTCIAVLLAPQLVAVVRLCICRKTLASVYWEDAPGADLQLCGLCRARED
jgi:hypothetical protein